MNAKLKSVIKRTVAYPYLLLRKYVDDKLSRSNPSRLMQRIYRRNMGKCLNLKNPKNLNEKIYYISYNSDTSLWTELADKVKVRDYITKAGFQDILCKLYGVYNSSNEIDYESLPKSFVMKTNNASATNIIVKDKSNLDIKTTNTQLDEWLKLEYGRITATPHYSRIEPKILIEEYLHDDNPINQVSLADYKFYCINGEPKAVMIYTERVPNSHIMKRMMYDMDWLPHMDWIGKKCVIGTSVEKPSTFDEMKRIASVLSKPFAFVRVDFYNVNNKVIFGEMTFTPGHIETSELFLEKFGKEIKIELS